MTIEIEAKFKLPNIATLRQLETVEQLADATLAPGKVLRVRDTYLDTSNRRILAAGYACRLRKQNDETIITLKQVKSIDGAVHEREELEIHLPAFAPPTDWQPSEARARVLEIIGEETLAPLFELRQTRTVRAIQRDDKTIAQMSLDVARIKHDGRTRTFREIEVELADGIPDDLTPIVAVLQNDWQLKPEPHSKFERALEFVERAKQPLPRRQAKSPRLRGTPGICLDDAMADAARKTLLFHLQRVVANEAGTREGQDIEALHDMRVATRRMRAALRVFAPYLNQATFKPFAKMLRQLGAVLGAVRDLDVFHEKTRHYLDQLSAERTNELDPLLAQWQTKYQIARQAMIDFLDDEAYRQFKSAFAKFLRTPGAGAAPNISKDGEPLPYRVRHVLPGVLHQGYASLRAFEESMQGDAVPLTRYHQLRIASKGLRYMLEFFQEVLAPNAKALIEQMKQLQDHLGNLQDAVVTCGILRDYLTWGTWGKKKSTHAGARGGMVIAPGVATYLAARQNEMQELVHSFPEIWASIVSPAFKQTLAQLADAG